MQMERNEEVFGYWRCLKCLPARHGKQNLNATLLSFNIIRVSSKYSMICDMIRDFELRKVWIFVVNAMWPTSCGSRSKMASSCYPTNVRERHPQYRACRQADSSGTGWCPPSLLPTPPRPHFRVLHRVAYILHLCLVSGFHFSWLTKGSVSSKVYKHVSSVCISN